MARKKIKVEVPPSPPPPTAPAFVGWLFSRMDGYEIALVIRGRKWAHCIVDTAPISVHKIRIEEAKRLREVEYHGLPYPIERSAKHFLKFGRAKGITERAKHLLQCVIDGKYDDPDESEALPAPDTQAEGRKPPITRPAGESGGIIPTLAAETGLAPGKIRAKLRSAGLSAPYTDLALCRAKLA